VTDEQAMLDLEDASLRLRRLVDAINARAECEAAVRQAEHALRCAKSKLKDAIRKEQELAFLERNRLDRGERG